MQHGGHVTRTGLALVHAGEMVRPAEATPLGGIRDRSSRAVFQIQVNTGFGTRADGERVARIIMGYARSAGVA
jgi:hypothetical protein